MLQVKLATLNYLRSLVTLVESADLPVHGKEAELALAKLITWTGEPKSAEIRREANLVLAAMFQAHSIQMQVGHSFELSYCLPVSMFFIDILHLKRML